MVCRTNGHRSVNATRRRNPTAKGKICRFDATAVLFRDRHRLSAGKLEAFRESRATFNVFKGHAASLAAVDGEQ